ncbi:MAG: hypothetical protein JNM88_04500 [Chitinophagaceae bacterium]|nr:hypothetical protein [Chitinophagaceae bacterium]
MASLLAATTLQAQLTITCPKLTDANAAFVYIGVDNPVEIKGMDKPEQFMVTISGGGSSITKVSTGHYIIRASMADSLTLSVIKMGKPVLRKRFKVEKLPEPVVTLADSTDNNVTKAAILAKPRIDIVFPGCLYKHGMEVTRFVMTIEKGEELHTITSDADRLNEKQLQLISEAAPGTMVTFDDVYVRDMDGTKRKVPSLVRYLW